MTITRAKFTVNAIERTVGSKEVVGDDGKRTWVPAEMWTVRLNSVYGNGDPEHENTKFWQASPSGSIQLSMVNQAAAEVFELGKDYYVDFRAAA